MAPISIFTAYSAGRYDAPGGLGMEHGGCEGGRSHGSGARWRVEGDIYYRCAKSHRLHQGAMSAGGAHGPWECLGWICAQVWRVAGVTGASAAQEVWDA
jgi:hypothetical protein